MASACLVADGTRASRASGPASVPTTVRLAWRSCGDMQCTTLDVPASYDDPNGRQLTLAVGRIAAAHPDSRVGVLFVNPGGPGVPTVNQLPDLAALLPRSVRDRFDIVAFDPRGVGRSTPIDCDVSIAPVFDRSFTPETDRAHTDLVVALQRVADSCAATNGAYLGQVSTADAARDMDSVRAALGNQRVSYVGFSYGTYLGALYAAMFPERVRALVLDGAIDPTVDAETSTLLQAEGFDANLDEFFRWCAPRAGCAFQSGGDPERAYDALRARIAGEPMRDDHGRALNDTRFDAAVLDVLYEGQDGFPLLGDALAEADRGSPATLLELSDSFLGQGPDGTDDGSVEAFWAVGCLDDRTYGDVSEAQALAARAATVAPRLGEFVANFSLACAVWPTRGIVRPSVPSLVGAAPRALVVGSTGDPATPLGSARRLARLLGDAPLVVVRGDRHTAVGGGNACVDSTVSHYLRAPNAPVTHARC